MVKGDHLLILNQPRGFLNNASTCVRDEMDGFHMNIVGNGFTFEHAFVLYYYYKTKITLNVYVHCSLLRF